jgi:hypothetical protein
MASDLSQILCDWNDQGIHDADTRFLGAMRGECRVNARSRTSPSMAPTGMRIEIFKQRPQVPTFSATYIVVLFRMYGGFNVVCGLMAIGITATVFQRSSEMCPRAPTTKPLEKPL